MCVGLVELDNESVDEGGLGQSHGALLRVVDNTNTEAELDVAQV
jgi:hypothetical protein